MTANLTAAEVESIARTIHERYLDARRADGTYDPQRATHQAWEQLAPAARMQNIQQLQEGHLKSLEEEGLVPKRADAVGADDVIVDSIEGERLLRMAKREHDRWVGLETIRNAGHASVVAWEDLTDAEKQKDFEPVRGLPSLLATVGIVIVESTPRSDDE